MTEAEENRPDQALLPPPPPRLGKTLRHGIRAAWDSLGLVCAVSFTLFAAISWFALTLTVALARSTEGARIAGACAAIGIFLALVPPLYTGACFVAHKALSHDEPSYGDLWIGFKSLYGRAFILGLIQMLGAAVLAGNLLFYASIGRLWPLLAAVVCGYMLVFWGMNALYHQPLLVAAHTGIITREDGGQPRIGAVLRNGLLLTVSSLWFTFGLFTVLAVTLFALAVSGVGMALIGPGLAAWLCTRATRNQLTRFDQLPPDPDPDAPVEADVWKLR